MRRDHIGFWFRPRFAASWSHDQRTYFAETVVHPDSSARRTIIQPVEYTPSPFSTPGSGTR